MKKQSLIFDFDGTLYDPLEPVHSSLSFGLHANHLPEIPLEVIKTFIGPPLSISLKKFFPNLSDDQINAIIAKFREHHNEHSLPLYKPYSGMFSILSSLKNNFELNIASSKPQKLLEAVVRYHKIGDLFSSIVGSSGNDGSSKTKYLEKILSQSPIGKDQTTMIGDRYFDIDAGKQVGTKTIAVTWGYGSQEELTQCQATAMVNSFTELERLLDNWS